MIKAVLWFVVLAVVVAAASTPTGTGASAANPQAILSGSLALGPASADLTQLGTEDWAVWGFANSGTSTSLAPDVRKTGGSAISDLTDVNPLSIPLRGIGQFPTFTFFTFSWSDGGSVPNATTVPAGLQHNTPDNVNSTGHGFSFKVPASKTPRRLKVYVHADGGTGKLTASLSGGSAATFSDTGLVGGLNAPGVYTIDYAAASAGQTLTVTWTLDSVSSDAYAVNNNAGIYAAALAGTTPTAPSCPDEFQVASAAQFPGVDRNGDGIVCAKAIDNKKKRDK